MIFIHFYLWNNFTFGEGSSLHLYWTVIKSTRLKQNLLNPRKWKPVINMLSAVWSFLSLAPVIQKPLLPQWSFPVSPDVPLHWPFQCCRCEWGRGSETTVHGAEIQPVHCLFFFPDHRLIGLVFIFYTSMWLRKKIRIIPHDVWKFYEIPISGSMHKFLLKQACSFSYIVSVLLSQYKRRAK